MAFNDRILGGWTRAPYVSGGLDGRWQGRWCDRYQKRCSFSVGCQRVGNQSSNCITIFAFYKVAAGPITLTSRLCGQPRQFDIWFIICLLNSRFLILKFHFTNKFEFRIAAPFTIRTIRTTNSTGTKWPLWRPFEFAPTRMLLISEPFQFGSDKIAGNQINLRSGQAKRCHAWSSIFSLLLEFTFGFTFGFTFSFTFSFTFKVLLSILLPI